MDDPALTYRGGVRRKPVEVHQITTAARSSHSQDATSRALRYLTSMTIRTVCVILTLIVPGPARWVFAAGAVLLPYVAVVLANAGARRMGTGDFATWRPRELPAAEREPE